jgi:peptide/nickel transport system permease protein
MPQLALLTVISGFVRVEAFHLGLVMALLGWMGVARLVRGQVLSLRETEFVLAARTIGAGGSRIVTRHLLPNVMAPVTVAATLAVAFTILIESALSYLGFGVHPPTPTWGNMLQGAQIYMRTAPWLAILPGVLIGITVTCFNLVGDGLREAIDPRLKGRMG